MMTFFREVMFLVTVAIPEIPLTPCTRFMTGMVKKSVPLN